MRLCALACCTLPLVSVALVAREVLRVGPRELQGAAPEPPSIVGVTPREANVEERPARSTVVRPRRRAVECVADEVIEQPAVAEPGILADVSLPDGSAPSSAAIEFVDSQGRRGRLWWTSDVRRFDIAPGEWTLTATCGDEERWRSQGVTVVVPEAGEV